MQEQSNDVSRDIPWEKWNLLSPEEISFLKSLNFNLLPEKGKKITEGKKVRFTSPDPQHATAPPVHLTETVVTCSFCKSKFSIYFDMVVKGNGLHGKRISEEHFSHLRYEKGKKSERIKEEAITCEHCTEFMHKKSKDEIIAIVLVQRIKIKTGRR